MDTPDATKQIVRVTIFNQTYSLSTSGDPRDMEAAAHEVDELMYSIGRRGGNLDTGRTAVLACLHLADRLRTTERELGALRETFTSKATQFSLILDQLMPPQEELKRAPQQHAPVDDLEDSVLPLHTSESPQIGD